MRLSRLCPVPGVRARGRADERLGSIWQSGTRDVHEASDALIRGKAPLAFSDPKLWAELLSQFYYVFRALETALERGAATDSRVHALHSTFFSRLARSSAFLSDVAYHSRGAPPAAPLPQTKEYADRIALLATQQPLLLVAYAQTLYLALLSGGRQLDRMLRGAMLLPAGKGASIFDFAALPSAERERFKRELHRAVDALGEALTSDERVALLQEKRSIFWRNDHVIFAVFKDARGSLLMAWLRLLRAVLLAYLRAWTVIPSLLLLLFLSWRWYRSMAVLPA